MVHFAFKFRDDTSAKNLSVIVPMCLMQVMKKKNFDDIVKDSDWNQYYGNKNTQEEEEPMV